MLAQHTVIEAFSETAYAEADGHVARCRDNRALLHTAGRAGIAKRVSGR